MESIVHPAAKLYIGLPGYIFVWIILSMGVGLFAHIIYRRWQLLRFGNHDLRFGDIGKRISSLFTYGFIQKRQPRYFWVGFLHIMIFWGFIVLGLRSFELITQGLGLSFLRPVMESRFGIFYNTLKDFFELIVLIACILAILRRAISRPKRYEGSHSFEAYLVLGLISFLMITDILYEGCIMIFSDVQQGWFPASIVGAFFLKGLSPGVLQCIYSFAYWLHIIAFFFFLNFLPLGKHFHIITALPNVFFRKLSKGSIKPARWEADDIDEIDSLGVGKFEDFTWKHILDFYTCTECGRCSDNCPAYTVGRPLSPKMFTMKLRDHGYHNMPIFRKKDSKQEHDEKTLIGGTITLDEIWSCTTCGACEEECPVFIEYIDKIIDMRRHLIETSQNPERFNQVLMQFENTGNPFGKPAMKRADWIRNINVPVKILKPGDKVDLLFFVDSYGSFDPVIQEISCAIAKGLHAAGVNFGILGPMEKDSGHQVRRIGEEGLFQFLVEKNLETLASISFKKIITTDPHAFNTLKKDYPGSFNVYHYTEIFHSLIKTSKLTPRKTLERKDIYTYHDPCYLGRHNGIYEAPRNMLKSIPGINIVEMRRSFDRSFCCGGGDIILWHEIEKEQTKMAAVRIDMAKEVGANVIVTACPFCLIHFEDIIKSRGLEEEIRVIDLMKLFESTL